MTYRMRITIKEPSGKASTELFEWTPDEKTEKILDDGHGLEIALGLFIGHLLKKHVEFEIL